MISFGDESGSGGNTNASSITLSHDVAAGVNRFLSIQYQARDTASATDPVLTGVTYNGDAMAIGRGYTKQDNAGQYMRVEVWGLPAPDVGTANVVASFTGVVNFTGLQALTLYGVKQTTTIHAYAEDGQAADSVNDPQVTVNTTIYGCVVIDSVYNQTVDTQTVGAGQEIIAAIYDPRSGGGDNAGATYKLTTTAGAIVMDWSTVSFPDKWAQVAVAYEPATVRGLIGVGILPFES